MSRIGKQPVVIPQGVKVEMAGQLFKIQGPKGKLERKVHKDITVKIEDNSIIFSRQNDSGKIRALHGLERALINNMVQGVSKGFEKYLEVIGVGYRAEVKGKILNLALGYSHPIDFPLPAGIKAEVIKENRDISIKLEGVDKQLVGEVAAQIRSLRAPEPYKGKGVRYRNEVIKLKAGKAGKK